MSCFDSYLEFSKMSLFFEICFILYCKTLGRIVDEQLFRENHINSVVFKLSKGSGMSWRMKKCVPKPVMIDVYNAIVVPHSIIVILYGITEVFNLGQKLQKMQNRATRVIHWTFVRCNICERT